MQDLEHELWKCPPLNAWLSRERCGANRRWARTFCTSLDTWQTSTTSSSMRCNVEAIVNSRIGPPT